MPVLTDLFQRLKKTGFRVILGVSGHNVKGQITMIEAVLKPVIADGSVAGAGLWEITLSQGPESNTDHAAESADSGPLGSGTGSAALGPAKIIDCHAHLNHHNRAAWEADDRKLIEAADQLGIEQLCCSILTPRRPATAEGFQERNRAQWLRL